MPAGYSQKSAQLRAERQATAGYRNLGGDAEGFEVVRGMVRSRNLLGFDLPLDPPGTELVWAEEVKEFYHYFRVSPQASLLRTDIEWQMVLVAMGLLNDFYTSGSLPAYTKFESLIAQFGVTPAAMKKIRVNVSDPTEDEDDDSDWEAPEGESEFNATFDEIVASMK